MLEAIFGLIVVLLDIYAIAKTIGSNASTRAKTLWVVGIFLLPVLGFLAWLLFGPDSPRYRRA